MKMATEIVYKLNTRIPRKTKKFNVSMKPVYLSNITENVGARDH